MNAATLTFGIAFAMMFFAFFFYMGNVWHYSQARAGLAIAPGPLMVIPVAVLTGRLAGRFGHRPFLIGGALLYAASRALVHARPRRRSRRTCCTGCPALLMSGTSVGMVLPSLSAAAVSRLPAQHYAVGSAVNQAIRQIGSVIGVAIIVLLLGHATVQRSRLRCRLCIAYRPGAADRRLVRDGQHPAGRTALVSPPIFKEVMPPSRDDHRSPEGACPAALVPSDLIGK